MIKLRPMLQQEYAGYLAYFLPDYALEITANYDQSPADNARTQRLYRTAGFRVTGLNMIRWIGGR